MQWACQIVLVLPRESVGSDGNPAESTQGHHIAMMIYMKTELAIYGKGETRRNMADSLQSLTQQVWIWAL
jgi:hypothetical protein